MNYIPAGAALNHLMPPLRINPLPLLFLLRLLSRSMYCRVLGGDKEGLRLAELRSLSNAAFCRSAFEGMLPVAVRLFLAPDLGPAATDSAASLAPSLVGAPLPAERLRP
mmetsp:Transcript_65117/g.113731  ORF Transcript_65117/g.113731 Transcript_65117/m.113731 type:complete len:109 (+) Transcript_65117:1-327(+)